MIGSPTTGPLPPTTVSPHHPIPMNWRERGIGLLRITFGLVYVVAATLKWQPQFQNTFVQQISAVSDGQPAPIQAWISFWTHLVSINPFLFARLEATTETVIAVFLIFGI